MIIEMSNLEAAKIHEFFISAMSPLPVTLISTLGATGVFNAAPFSAVAPISWKPPLICVSVGSKNGRKKHTTDNIEYSGDFVINIMSADFLKPLVQAAGNYPGDVSEIERVGLTALPAQKVKSPLIGEAQVSFECRLAQRIELGEGENIRWVYFGEVLIMHLKDDILTSGDIDPLKLGGMGYLGKGPFGKRLFCRTRDVLQS